MQIDLLSAIKYIGTLMLATFGFVSPEALDEFRTDSNSSRFKKEICMHCQPETPGYLTDTILYINQKECMAKTITSDNNSIAIARF